MGDNTKNLREGPPYGPLLTPSAPPLHWGAEVLEVPSLVDVVTHWFRGSFLVSGSRNFEAYIARVAWSTQFQINLPKTANEVIKDLLGTDLREGHDPLRVQGKILGGLSITLDGVEYAVILGGIYHREKLSAVEENLLKSIPLHVLPRHLEVPQDPAIEILFDRRDIDENHVSDVFGAVGLSPEFIPVSLNGHEAIVEALLQLNVHWAVLAWGTPFGRRLQENLADQVLPSIARGATQLRAAIGKLAQLALDWRKPVVCIQTVVGPCHILFQFRRLSEHMRGLMIEDLDRAVDQACSLVNHYSDSAPGPFRQVAYEFSSARKMWALHSIITANNRLLSAETAPAIARLVGQSTSLGLSAVERRIVDRLAEL